MIAGIEDDLPDELIEAMGADPELTEAFPELTPGRQTRIDLGAP